MKSCTSVRLDAYADYIDVLPALEGKIKDAAVH